MCDKKSEALFLDVAMGDMTPKGESKREWFMSPYIYVDICIKNI